jgi:hypothetical protein
MVSRSHQHQAVKPGDLGRCCFASTASWCEVPRQLSALATRSRQNEAVGQGADGRSIRSLEEGPQVATSFELLRAPFVVSSVRRACTPGNSCRMDADTPHPQSWGLMAGTAQYRPSAVHCCMPNVEKRESLRRMCRGYLPACDASVVVKPRFLG